MLKNKRFWYFLLAGVVLIGGGYLAYLKFFQPDPTQSVSEIQTATVRRGDISVIAGAVGTIVPASEIDLSFSTSGTLAELNVRVGDKVQAGDELAKLGNLSSLEASVASADLNYLEAQQNLDDLYNNADSVAAAAQLELADAQQALQDAINENLGLQPGNRASAEDYASVYANYVLAVQRLEDAQKRFDRFAKRPEDDVQRANALAALEEAKATVDAYYRQLEWFDAAPSELEQAQLDAAIEVAKARVEEAQRQWDLVKDGPSNEEIAMAEAQLANAKAQLDNAHQTLDGTTLVAPMNGTVLAVNADVGENVGTSTFITLANVDQPLLEIYLDESDFDLFHPDYKVEVTFDSLPDEVFTGKVIQVDPELSVNDGVPTVTGMVELDPTDSDVLSRLPLGSNASVDVIAAQALDAVLVPVEALREISDGQYAVFVVGDGELQVRMVEVGLMDITYAEIISGLDPGEVVSTGIVETQ